MAFPLAGLICGIGMSRALATLLACALLATAATTYRFFSRHLSPLPSATATATPLPEHEQSIEENQPPVIATAGDAPRARPFQRIDGCRLIPNRWNDGDSFHVITGDAGKEIVARLYFVDTPEAETAYRDRLDEQAAYWRITRAQAKDIAHEAAAFTAKRLAEPFTVWTRWNSARGRSALGRVYCIIVDSTGRDLNELLIENGLARIYGVRTPLFDGRTSAQYRARLAELEATAKKAKRGAWRFVK